jgi:hypothetical protein
MAEANSMTAPPKRRWRRIDWFSVPLGALAALMVMDAVVVKEFPDSRYAHWHNRLWWGIPVAIIESDVRELDEAVSATADELARKRAERDSVQGDLDRGALPPGLPDSAFARLVIRRDALDEEIAALETRLGNLRHALDRNRAALGGCGS